MSEKKRTFKQLEKEKTYEDLNKFAKEVTNLYATSSLGYSQKKIARDNNITIPCLRQLIDYSIKICLVTRETATLVLNKAIKNQQAKAYEAGESSLKHHREIIKQREQYIAYSYSRVEIEKIAKKIANSSKPLVYFAEQFNMESVGIVRIILKRAIEENIASDEDTEKIIERSLKGNRTEYAEQYFRNLLNKRKLNKEKDLK